MGQKIEVGEMNVLESSRWTIRTRCAWDAVDHDMILKLATYRGLSAGDSILIQCLDFNYERLLAEAEYRVIGRKDEMKVTEKPDFSGHHHADRATFEIVRWTDWRHVPGFVEEQPEGFPDTGMRAVWNVGAKGYDIMKGDQKVGFHTDKETAQRIAAGMEPLTEAA